MEKLYEAPLLNAVPLPSAAVFQPAKLKPDRVKVFNLKAVGTPADWSAREPAPKFDSKVTECEPSSAQAEPDEEEPCKTSAANTTAIRSRRLAL